MKIITTLFVFCCLIVHAENINFTDPVFKAKLLASSNDFNNYIATNLSGSHFKIDSNNDGEISIGEALMVKELNVSSSGISSLDGLQYFANLKNLECEYNQLTSSLDVHMLSLLERFYCYSNQLTNLNVSGLSNLTHLLCGSNLLTSLDVTGSENLSQLNCDNNQLTTLAFHQAARVSYLKCNNNQLTQLNVSDLHMLSDLFCSYNQLTQINFNNIPIRYISCHHNQLTSLTLINCTRLESLYCSNNLLTALDFSQLNNTSSFYPFYTLACDDNNLTGTIDLLPIKRLDYLNCSNNQLTGIENVQFCTILSTIKCSYNNFSELNLNGATDLEILECTNNPTQSMYLKNVKNTFSINMHENPNLQYICASPNKIAYLQQIATLENYSSCLIDSNCVFTLDNETFISKTNVSLYPNPAGNSINFDMKNFTIPYSIDIYNLLGQLTLNIPNPKDTNSIDVSHLKSGQYFVKVISDKGISTTKFIKE